VFSSGGGLIRAFSGFALNAKAARGLRVARGRAPSEFNDLVERCAAALRSISGADWRKLNGFLEGGRRAVRGFGHGPPNKLMQPTAKKRGPHRELAAHHVVCAAADWRR
jgi:hypothetical protein